MTFSYRVDGQRGTSGYVQGLIAQRRTIQETLEIARNVARNLIELQAAHQK